MYHVVDQVVSHGNMYFLIAVLATIENDIQNVSVVEGERATFTCEFLKGNISDIAINWSVGDIPFNDCDSTEDDTTPNGNGCYTNDTHSVLVLNTLDPGSYPVQCILQQNIPDDFKNDPSFQENFNSITRSASLTISMNNSKLLKAKNPVLDIRFRHIYSGIYPEHHLRYVYPNLPIRTPH